MQVGRKRRTRDRMLVSRMLAARQDYRTRQGRCAARTSVANEMRSCCSGNSSSLAMRCRGGASMASRRRCPLITPRSTGPVTCPIHFMAGAALRGISILGCLPFHHHISGCLPYLDSELHQVDASALHREAQSGIEADPPAQCRGDCTIHSCAGAIQCRLAMAEWG